MARMCRKDRLFVSVPQMRNSVEDEFAHRCDVRTRDKGVFGLFFQTKALRLGSLANKVVVFFQALIHSTFIINIFFFCKVM